VEILAGKCFKFTLQKERTYTHTHTEREREKEREKQRERENGERQRESESAGKEREEASGENDREINVGENERIFGLEVFGVHGDDEEREAAEGSLREQTSESASAGGVQRGLMIEIWFRERSLFP
jgi:hypothetical protein